MLSETRIRLVLVPVLRQWFVTGRNKHLVSGRLTTVRFCWLLHGKLPVTPNEGESSRRDMRMKATYQNRWIKTAFYCEPDDVCAVLGHRKWIAIHKSSSVPLSLLLLSLCIALLTGCQKLGPASVRVGLPAYNIAINETRQQLLLLNIVRQRYSETPYLMEVSNIFAAPSYSAKANAGKTFGNDLDNFGTASAELNYSEAPVIVYTPVGGEQLSRRLLQPVSLDTLGLLVSAGWDIDRLFRLCVQQINNVWNAAGPEPGISGSLRE